MTRDTIRSAKNLPTTPDDAHEPLRAAPPTTTLRYTRRHCKNRPTIRGDARGRNPAAFATTSQPDAMRARRRNLPTIPDGAHEPSRYGWSTTTRRRARNAPYRSHPIAFAAASDWAHACIGHAR